MCILPCDAKYCLTLGKPILWLFCVPFILWEVCLSYLWSLMWRPACLVALLPHRRLLSLRSQSHRWSPLDKRLFTPVHLNRMSHFILNCPFFLSEVNWGLFLSGCMTWIHFKNGNGWMNTLAGYCVRKSKQFPNNLAVAYQILRYFSHYFAH